MSFLSFNRYFFKGLQRNFKIIRYGDVPEVYKTPLVVERYAFASPSIKGHLRSLKELAKHLLRSDLKTYEMPEALFIYCGGSANNEREFSFFSRLVLDELPVSEYSRKDNISFVNTKVVKKTRFEYTVSFYLFFLCLLYLFRIKLGPVSLKYLLTYAKVFLNVYASTRRHDMKVHALVVANDHTDFPVAASMVMQYQKIPVVYVQHAEVSDSFPPLDFSVSVLRNQKSLDIYRSIGKVSGDAFVVPRRQESQNLSKIFQKKSGKVPVAIYLSSVFSQDAVVRCVDALKTNANVLSIGIKPHPRASQEFLRSISDVTIHDSIPAFEHIAIVPNSSVVIELLEAGIPVFQYFELDDVGHDYYGFVREEIAPEVSLKDLYFPFWNSGFFNDQWLLKFAAYSPSVNDSWRVSLPTLISKMKSYIRTTS
ncbi:hypothetical protein [Franzmannia qiaohouensis]|uniref:Glycosyltransferase n=1 Tax=Franzmannia qiaohouensis TaxID=1329370 RepID=A0ABU1HLQ0_9GAMM|nr:hypothetical protein [Halomonas qiaohouensis]MDR5907500.1 hypothetical protein [Halomonas qiaohouensis]